jgi:hypothetical protein
MSSIYADAAGFTRYWSAAATRIFCFAEGEASAHGSI